MTTSDAVSHFGSATKLARALGIKPAAVSQWGEYPPLLRQFQIELVSKRKLRAEVAA